jgi:hypothetical protein
MNITTLAQLKRELKEGVTVTIIDNKFWNNKNHPAFNKPRSIIKVQTNSLKYSDNSWMDFGKAKDYQFNGNTFTWLLDNEGHFITYRID